MNSRVLNLQLEVIIWFNFIIEIDSSTRLIDLDSSSIQCWLWAKTWSLPTVEEIIWGSWESKVLSKGLPAFINWFFVLFLVTYQFILHSRLHSRSFLKHFQKFVAAASWHFSLWNTSKGWVDLFGCLFVDLLLVTTLKNAGSSFRYTWISAGEGRKPIWYEIVLILGLFLFH